MPLRQVAMAFHAGARKYGRDDWLKLPKGNRLAAAYRHLEADRGGEQVDRQDDVFHLAMAAADLLMELAIRYK